MSHLSSAADRWLNKAQYLLCCLQEVHQCPHFYCYSWRLSISSLCKRKIWNVERSFLQKKNKFTLLFVLWCCCLWTCCCLRLCCSLSNSCWRAYLAVCVVILLSLNLLLPSFTLQSIQFLLESLTYTLHCVILAAFKFCSKSKGRSNVGHFNEWFLVLCLLWPGRCRTYSLTPLLRVLSQKTPTFFLLMSERHFKKKTKTKKLCLKDNFSSQTPKFQKWNPKFANEKYPYFLVIFLPKQPLFLCFFTKRHIFCLQFHHSWTPNYYFYYHFVYVCDVSLKGS